MIAVLAVSLKVEDLVKNLKKVSLTKEINGTVDFRPPQDPKREKNLILVGPLRARIGVVAKDLMCRGHVESVVGDKSCL